MAKEKNSKNEKNNGRSFKKDFKAELKKVVWPTSKQMVNNVIAVLTIVIITALIVFVLDLAFGAMNNYGINKLKEKVEAKNNTAIENVVDNATDENNDEATAEENSEESENTENAEATENNIETENNEAESTENAESAN